jgi:hypothetical protein
MADRTQARVTRSGDTRPESMKVSVDKRIMEIARNQHDVCQLLQTRWF